MILLYYYNNILYYLYIIEIKEGIDGLAKEQEKEDCQK